MDDLLEMGERVLTVDIPDEIIERSATTQGQAVTWVHCTHAWQYCEWPQVGGSTASIHSRRGSRLFGVLT